MNDPAAPLAVPLVAPLVSLEALRKTYNAGLPSEQEVLHGLDLRINAGEFAALIGPSA